MEPRFRIRTAPPLAWGILLPAWGVCWTLWAFDLLGPEFALTGMAWAASLVWALRRGVLHGAREVADLAEAVLRRSVADGVPSDVGIDLEGALAQASTYTAQWPPLVDCYAYGRQAGYLGEPCIPPSTLTEAERKDWIRGWCDGPAYSTLEEGES